MASYCELTDDDSVISESCENTAEPEVIDESFYESSSSSKSAILTKKQSVPMLSDDDDDDQYVAKPKSKKKNVIISDSEDEMEEIEKMLKSNSESDEEKLEIDYDSDSSESLHSINYDDEPLPENIKGNSASGRISSVHNFGNKGSIMNSTLIGGDAKSPRKLNPLNEESTFALSSTNNTINIHNVVPSPRKSTPRGSRAQTSNIKLKESMMTPRAVKHDVSSRSPSPSMDNDDIVDISSDEDIPITPKPQPNLNRITMKQTTLDSMVSVKSEVKEDLNTISSDGSAISLDVTPTEYMEQRNKLQKIQSELLKAKNTLRTINLNALPDKGKLLQQRYATLEQMYDNETKKLEVMNISKEDPPSPDVLKPVAWADIQAGVSAVQPKTFGKKAMATYNAQKALTVDRLAQLHGSLEKCPKEDTLAEDPKGLKVELMPHQKRALAWMMFREKQKPSGGILADDMGLGKTLTMLSLMLKTFEVEKREDSDEDDEENREERDMPRRTKFKGGTLVVCPASLLNQWSGELENRSKRGLASYYVYHGPKRERKAKLLSDYDLVITTYSIVQNEHGEGTVFRVRWRRVILDEAHQIRNHKSLTSVAVCNLPAKSRWALTGTPIHNKELDMFALLKFLRCSPFDDLQVWRRWVGDKSVGGLERLHTVISSLMLRRTKAELMEKGALNCMPERKWELIPVELLKNEQEVYHRVNLFSRTLFAQFLHQRAQKNQDVYDANYANAPNAKGPNNEYFKMRDKLLKMNKIQEVSQHHILVLLLRLRQICCHPSLITAMLDETEELGDDGDEMNDLNLLDQLSKLNLDEDEDAYNPNATPPAGPGEEGGQDLKQATKGFLNPSNPVFSLEHQSSKIKVVLDTLEDKVLGAGDKAIIVSQFPSFLRIVGRFLKERGIEFDQLDGSIPVNKRMGMVDNFNNKNHKMRVLLLSLTAGGVGLNLIGANHLFLLDLHWNPQLENQAQDRIYRVGQTKPVFVYKFIATDTIEERIKQLQDKKLDCATSMLTGTKQAGSSKLTLQDIKMLFDM
ncbi:unnamed protein product [Brassicogethes aeneus]|uniref:Transcription termination factor 2 n=1 Tax=Brassicogethes aeneus TaxID=1431903 RepID=A0A9P0FMP7_BRAAE|nr:unnamed protein product [Brassicogethes aeneus]